jgi:hypothetical protein
VARWHGWEGVAGRQAVAGSREHTGWGTVIVYGFYAQRLPGGVGETGIGGSGETMGEVVRPNGGAAFRRWPGQ